MASFLSKAMFRISFSLPRWWLLLPLLALVGCIWFCIYYLTNGYDHLLRDFREMHGCFYRSETFEAQYFSPAVKDAGNRWCKVGLAVCGLLLSGLGWTAFKGKTIRFSEAFAKKDGYAVMTLCAFAFTAWLWGFVRAQPAYDEVFSAINVAGEGPALAIRYYMLPNNHVLFNVLNSLLPGDGSDKVFTGRILSGVAHFGTVAMLYCWLRNRDLSTGWAFFFGAVLLLFYPIWAFSCQARGYSIYLFCCWAALVSLDAYFRKSEVFFLLVHLLAAFVGFAVMPAYLYWHLGMLCYSFCAFSFFRKDKNRLFSFLKMQLVLAAVVFLFYLPSIVTSGLAAYTKNPYVTPHAGPFREFFKVFLEAFDDAIRYSFASDIDGTSVVYLFAFCLPLLAWPFCNKEGKRAALQFFVFWAVFCVMQLGLTRRWPFMRNMVAHCSLFAAVFPVVFYHTVQRLSGRFRVSRAVPALLTGTLLLLTGVHYLRFMKDHLNDLYYNSLSKSYTGAFAPVDVIPADARVWYSDESFFPHFLLLGRKIPASHCAEGDYNFLVLDHRLEKLPAALESIPKTEIFRNEQYVVYRRN